MIDNILGQQFIVHWFILKKKMQNKCNLKVVTLATLLNKFKKKKTILKTVASVKASIKIVIFCLDSEQ